MAQAAAGVKVRSAGPEDVPQILELIRELAEYERAPDKVAATEADLLAYGFGGKPYFHAFLAELEGRIVGFALYFFAFSTWEGRPTLYIEDIFVRPASRGRGAGRALLSACAREALRRDCRRMHWQVLDWNQPAIDFYQGQGAYHAKAWLPFRMEREVMEALAKEC